MPIVAARFTPHENSALQTVFYPTSGKCVRLLSVSAPNEYQLRIVGIIGSRIDADVTVLPDRESQGRFSFKLDHFANSVSVGQTITLRLTPSEFDAAVGKSQVLAFTANTRFGLGDGDEWISYIHWSKLWHLKELITLDQMLCKPLIDTQDFTEPDWSALAPLDYQSCFTSLAALMDYIARHSFTNHQILAVMREPLEKQIERIQMEGFRFAGFDLMDSGISSLVNCGGWDKVFPAEELSDAGLIPTFARAKSIQEQLPIDYPEEAGGHANCDLWAIWRKE